MNRIPLLIVAAILVTGSHAADLSFQSGIASGMVIQRGKPIPLSGSAIPGSALTITLASQTQSTKADGNGHWSLTLPAMNEGGPYTLAASQNGQSVKIDDVLLGDVWVCSGQSNMQMGLAEAIGGADAIADLTRRPTVRFLEMPRGGADVPESDFKAEWKHGSPETLAKFSAVGGFFAAHLHRDPALAKIPLGIINSSFGGTSIEAWSPVESLADTPPEKISGSMFGLKPGTLFNHMIHPLFARPIKGVLWYQGEANAGQPAVYVRLLRNLMEQWREGWNQPDLPFLIVQLPAFDGTMGGLDFGWLREAEIQACTGFPNAWSAVTYDTTDGLDLHPKEKEEIGRRLSLIAKREVYGMEANAHGPRMVKVETSGNRLTVTFDQELKSSRGKSPLGFAIAGDDGDYRFATATLRGNQAMLEADGVPHPATVRYAWGGLTDANLTNIAGLPAFPFRNDTFAPDSMVFQPMPAFRKIETPVYQLETGSGGRIASLIIRGKQFLSNEPGGGTSVPTFLGPHNLASVRATGPGRLVLSDAAVEVEIACKADSMVWTVRNKDESPIDFHILPDSQVRADGDENKVTLVRDHARLIIEGLDHREPGGKLIAKVPPKSAAVLKLAMPE